MTHPFLERARRTGAPLIEDGEAIFLWEGDDAPDLIGDFNNWEDGEPLELLPLDDGLWGARLALPQDAYIEYAFLWGNERRRDPLNRRRSPNGFGWDNNTFYMPAARPTALNRPRFGVPAGRVSQVQITSPLPYLRWRRNVHLYQPPVDGPVPLLVVLDGREYLERVKLNVMLDNLLALGRIRPLALALVENHPQQRFIEYGCSEVTLAILERLVLPAAYEHLHLLDHQTWPGCHAILGASMGGLMALYSGLRRPEIFGSVLSQSGAFTTRLGDFINFDLAEHLPRRDLRIWMEVGAYDIPWLLEGHRRMVEILERRGYAPIHREYNAGHNYPAWRDEIEGGLTALFPPV